MAFVLLGFAPCFFVNIIVLQQEMSQMALGAAYWSDKKSKYTIERTLAKRARDMGMLTGGGDSDPATLQAMFLEMLCERSEFIIQVWCCPVLVGPCFKQCGRSSMVSFEGVHGADTTWYCRCFCRCPSEIAAVRRHPTKGELSCLDVPTSLREALWSPAEIDT